jgi:hypothetical protein
MSRVLCVERGFVAENLKRDVLLIQKLYDLHDAPPRTISGDLLVPMPMSVPKWRESDVAFGAAMLILATLMPRNGSLPNLGTDGAAIAGSSSITDEKRNKALGNPC